jgi:uncharacterized low-complexity protein
MSKKDKKDLETAKIIAMATGSLILGAPSAMASEANSDLYSYSSLGSGQSVRSSLIELNNTQEPANTSLCYGDRGKSKEGKCGEGKCGKGMKKGKDSKCGEGRCGEGKCGEGMKKGKEGKCGEGKCGEGKCGEGMKKGKEAKCGEGKCGEGKCGS